MRDGLELRRLGCRCLHLGLRAPRIWVHGWAHGRAGGRYLAAVGPSVHGVLGVCLLLGGATAARAQSLPDSPGSLLAGTGQMFDPQSASGTQAAGAQAAGTAAGTQDAGTQDGAKAKAKQSDQTPEQARQAAQEESDQRSSARLPPCPMSGLQGTIVFLPGTSHDPCQEQNQLQFIVETGHTTPLTVGQKGMLAVRGVVDPFNLLSIAFFSSITIAENAHTAYGPGLDGAGKLTGYSLVGDIQGEFLGTFLIPAVTHEDPRYRRMPGAPFSRRLAHALVHTLVTQHDDGSLMPNYSALLGYPIGNELANLYVPGLQTKGSATAQRILVGIATDPVGQVVAEFLPDVAKRIHIRVIFVQQILNQVALDPNVP